VRTSTQLHLTLSHSRGLRPMLDVVIQHGAAACLYKDAGWIRAGETVVQFGNAGSVTELLFVSPP
jgi:hypothetical protein